MATGVARGLTPEREALIDRGHRAQAARIETEHFARDRQDKVIQDMISAYRAKTLTYEFLVGKVGELVALKDLVSELGSYETQGYVAKDRSNGA